MAFGCTSNACNQSRASKIKEEAEDTRRLNLDTNAASYFIYNETMCHQQYHNPRLSSPSARTRSDLMPLNSLEHSIKHNPKSCIIYFSKDSTSLLTFSSLSKKAPNSSESTSGMAPALLGAATATGVASTAGALEKADLILKRIKIPKYPPRMTVATLYECNGPFVWCRLSIDCGNCRERLMIYISLSQRDD